MDKADDTSVRLSWSPKDACSYSVAFSSDGSDPSTKAWSSAQREHAHLVDGLIANTPYKFRVQATYSGGAAVLSNTLD